MHPTTRIALAVLSSLAMSSAFAGDRSFEAELERCLAYPGAAPVECAHVSAIRSRSEKVRVEYALDLTTGQPDPNEMKVCEQSPGNDFCTLYECGESDGQSVCLPIGHCFEADNQSKCTD